MLKPNVRCGAPFAPRPAVVCALLLGFAVVPARVDAQYFGRNKVNYERFDFRILKSPRFDVYFYPAESLATADAARMLERWYERFSPFLRHTLTRRSVVLFADQPDFQQNNIVDIESEGTGGVTEGFRQRVVLPFTGVYSDNNHVLGHELVHVFQYDMSRNPVAQGGEGGPGGTTTARGGGLGLNALPLWFVEGMAEYLSSGRNDPNTAMWMRDAVRRNDLPTARQLTTDTRYFPYRYGQALWAYVGGRYGDQAVVNLFRSALRVGVERAFRDVLRISPDSLSKEWAAATRAAYQPTLAGRVPPESVGTRLVIQRTRRGGEYNISPAVSPDGRHVAFFSSRSLFAIQIFIADAETGRIVAQLGSINTPTHYDALSFLSSPGSWSPDGQRLAYVIYRQGNQVIDVYNVRTRRSETVVTPPGVGAALDPAWSPDGRYIAFSGLAGGISDLYVHDLTSGTTEQLTTGRNAEIQPSWSPDGRTLVFATDRGEGTDFGRLTFGQMRLATIDVSTREVRLLPALAGGKAINPHYAPDGSSIYFVSDADGVSDIYRHEVATGSVFRITRVSSGISGISRLSPSISVARQTGRLVFSVFRGQGYDIVRLDPGELAGVPVARAAGEATAGVLPPLPTATAGVVESFLADASTGLPPEPVTYAITPYRARLGLEYIAPPTVGVTFGGPFGTQAGGGIAALFRDHLGNHNVVGVLQSQGELRDIGGQVVYQNFLRRWNYGAMMGRIPSISGFSAYGTDEATGLPTYNQVIQRIYYTQGGAFAQYPFSPIHRIEFSAVTTRQSYSVEVDQYLIQGNRIVDQRRIEQPAPDPLTYTQATAAFVGDYSLFGLTSPIAGARYRVEASPVFGAIKFTSGLLDYRRYLYLRPVTVAARVMHYGRYGGDAEDSTRLSPIFVGQPWFVRGYDPGDFTASECAAQAGTTNQCPVFSRMIGSRIAVANAELRVPVLGPYGFGVIATRFLPLELSPFVDLGLAWRSGESPDFRLVSGDEARTTLDRVPVVSAGISARTNLFGMAVVEVYWAHPFQRPDRGAHFGFQIAPGW